MSGRAALSPRHIRMCAFLVAEELSRRRRQGTPIPDVLTDLHRALTRQMAASNHETGSALTPSATFETVGERARRLGVSQTTVRRYARQAGAHKVGRDWIFET